MRTSVYISGNDFWVCTGTATPQGISIQSMDHGQMPEIMTTGEEEDSAAQSEYLRLFWQERQLNNKQIKLIFDQNDVHTKLLSVPLVRERELLNLVQNEYLPDMEQDEDNLYDYFVLKKGSKNGGGEVLGVSVARELVGQRLEIFGDAQIAVSNIDISLTSVIRFRRLFPTLNDKTFILVVVNGDQMMLVEFIDGHYHFSNTAVLFEERGTAAAAVEISRAVSQMIQFNQAEKTDAVIEEVFVCGFNDTENGFIGSMTDYLEIPVSPLPGIDTVITSAQVSGGVAPQECFFAVAGLIDD